MIYIYIYIDLQQKKNNCIQDEMEETYMFPEYI